MYNLIEYSDNYSKTSGSLWKYCKEIPAVNNDGNIVDFDGANATVHLILKQKLQVKLVLIIMMVILSEEKMLK